jgi:threonylcarbamoyladenosine tRNA methylthiotransferase MtaB
LAEVLDEVRRLRDNGYRELVLTGVHLGHYGVEQNRGKAKADWLRLSHLVRRIAEIDGDFRLRLSSLEATEVTRELVETVAEFPDKICPHLHVCLQSGSDRVLRRMRRRWGVRMFVDRCRCIQEHLTLPALTTDVIVGFPGEEEQDFANTCQVVRDVGFSKIHVFPFSPRQGTPAADMPDQVPPHVKAARVRRLTELEEHLRQAYFERLIGQRLRVLVESAVDARPDRWAGTACRYAPVELSGMEQLAGQLVWCVPQSVSACRLHA